MDEIMLKVDNVSKRYKLGQIGGTTLRDELQRLGAKIRGKEDPTKRLDTKDYNKGESFMALDGVSLEVKAGERVGIIGHNGAGKSTLLKLISRVTAPTGGAIGLNGRVASMLEVGTGFHGELTGRENIYMNGAILGMTKKEIDAKMEDIIEFSECRQFIDTPVKRYSSGMYVKLAFSVAAHLDSEIMIMDEVLAVGDVKFQQKCLSKMRDAASKEGRTVLYVSHNMSTIRQLCDKCIVLNKGKIAYEGDVEKAIAIYEDYGINRETVKDFRNLKRGDIDTSFTVKILECEYLDLKHAEIEEGSKLRMRLLWKNLERVDNLGLKFEIRRMGDYPVGTAVAYDFYSGDKGEIAEYIFEINTSRIVKGNYTTYLTPFTITDTNVNIDRDCVSGLGFTVNPSPQMMEWYPKNLGSLRLDEMIVQRIG